MSYCRTKIQLKVLTFATFLVLTFCKTVYAQDSDDVPWDCDNGQIIAIDQLCDGLVHCDDESDEIAENCIHQRSACPSYAFRCAYGGCVTGNNKCNGIKNCADLSDEMPLLCGNEFQILELQKQLRGNCSDDTYMQCKSGECIENDLKCDGRFDCEDQSDETVELCSTNFCPSYAFSCGYGGCVNGNYKCDGKNDCPDGSDEAAQLCGNPRRRDVQKYSPTTGTQTTTTTTTVRSIVNIPTGDGCLLPVDRQHLIVYDNRRNRLQLGTYVQQNVRISYECDRSYVRQGVAKNFCAGSNWNSPVPDCFKYCSLSEIYEGYSTHAVCYYRDSTVKCNNEIRPETKALVSCASGFVKPSVTGGRFQSQLTCDATGLWDFQKNRCVMQCGLLTPEITQFAKGGVNINITEVPWHVAIYSIFDYSEYTHICGGSIISPKFVLSAAHCFWDKANEKLSDVQFFTVVAGKYFRDYYSTKEQFPVQKRNISVIILDDYKDLNERLRNDIAILELDKHFKFSHSIRPVCIEFFSNADTRVLSNIKGRFAGWGITDDQRASEVLQAVTMQTLSYEDCTQLLRSTGTNYELPNDKFCLKNEYGSTACRGDSGGGFVLAAKDREGNTYYRLIGIISNAPVRDQDCAKDSIVALTNVQYFKEKITYQLDKEQRTYF